MNVGCIIRCNTPPSVALLVIRLSNVLAKAFPIYALKMGFIRDCNRLYFPGSQFLLDFEKAYDLVLFRVCWL
jgi:hypothetical protein